MQYENRRSSGIKASPSMAVSMAARKLRAEGRDIVDLSLGEPDFEPPTHVLDAVHAAVKAGGVRYGAAAGTESLRKAIIAKFSRDNQLEFSADELTVANGAKQILVDTFLATLEEAGLRALRTGHWFQTDREPACSGNHAQIPLADAQFPIQSDRRHL